MTGKFTLRLAVALSCAGLAGGASTGALPASAAAVPWQWVSVGPSKIDGPYGQSSGRVSALAQSPNGDLFAATANGGVWRRSVSAWQPLTDSQPNLAFGAIAIAASDPTIVYAATGEAHDCSDCGPGSGVTRGTKSGAEWTTPSLVVTGYGSDAERQRAQGDCKATDDARSSSIIVDAKDAEHVIVGNTAGVFVTTDGAKTWKRTWCYPVSDIKALNGFTSLVMGDLIGINTSSNGGESWTPVPINAQELPVELDVYNYYSIALAVAPSRADTVYASIAHANYGGGIGCLAGLLVSRGTGPLDFKRIPVPDYFASAVAYGSGTDCQGTYDNTIAVDPANADKIFVGGIALFSVDMSTAPPTVENLMDRRSPIRYPQLHPDQHALLFAPNGSLFIGNDGGVSELLPDGQLLNRNEGLRITQFSRGGSQQGDGDRVVAGTQDNGTVDVSGLRSKHLDDDSAAAWCAIGGGDGGMTSLVPGTRGLYIESQRGTIRRLRSSRPPCLVAGTAAPYPDPNWSDIAPPFAVTPEKAPWITPYVIVRGAEDMLIAGGDNVFLAQDVSGDAKVWSPLSSYTWTPFSPDPWKPLLISTITVGDDKGQIIYAGHATNGALQYSFKGGGSSADWRLEDPIGSLGTGAPNDGSRGDVTDIVLAPDSPYHIFVAIKSGRTSYIFETQDASAHPVAYTNVGTAGLRTGVNRMLLLKGSLIVATDDGVYRHEPMGWLPLGKLPAVPVVDLIPTESGCLFALTHGRGAWYACPGTNGA